jgi:hypothetical protein
MSEPVLVKLLKRGFPYRHIIAKLTRAPVFGRLMYGTAASIGRLVQGS